VDAGLEQNRDDMMPEDLGVPMRKSGPTEFDTYLKERNRRTKTALSAIEKAGTEAALDRCRALARRIQADLRHKKPEHFVNVMSLADFQVSLERAASVLECGHRRFEANPSERDM
jgi:hypothetical protein